MLLIREREMWTTWKVSLGSAASATPNPRRLSVMKKTALSLALMGLLALGGQAVATICTIDAVPAATLLLPYFEVDLNNPNGLTTLFSVNNASATAVLVHVVMWSDLAVPVLDFNVYLTGYDVQSVNLRDIIVNGNLPQTASTGQDPNDTISPKGSFSQDINFATCMGQLPPPNIGTGVHQPSAGGADRPGLSDLARHVRRPGAGRQHRARLPHGRHGERLLAPVPRRPRLFRGGREGRRHEPEPALGEMVHRRHPAPERDRLDHGGDRGQRPASGHFDPRPVHVLRLLCRLDGGGQPRAAGDRVCGRLRHHSAERGGHRPDRLARPQGRAEPVPLPGHTGR